MGPNAEQQTVVQKEGLQKKPVSWAEPSSMVTMKEYSIVRTSAGSRIWYQPNEIKTFKADNRILCLHAMHLVEQQKQQGDSKQQKEQSQSCYCTRGLEVMMYGKDRMIRKQKATSIVLQEQHDQRLQKTSSPDFIAELYNEISSLAQNDAHQLGLQDQQEAASIHKEEEVEEKKNIKSSKTKTLIRQLKSGDAFFQRLSHGGRIFRSRTTIAPVYA